MTVLASPIRRRAERGVVLPVVLVMLLLMTITVLFLMRRSTVDELLASNVRQIVTLETATQFALRSCERWLWVSVPGLAPRAGDPDPPAVVTAPAPTATAAGPLHAAPPAGRDGSRNIAGTVVAAMVGRNPLSASANIATVNHVHDPVVRLTFIAPTLPVPCSVMSSPVIPRTMMYANGIEPMRYASTNIAAAGHMRSGTRSKPASAIRARSEVFTVSTASAPRLPPRLVRCGCRRR